MSLISERIKESTPIYYKFCMFGVVAITYHDELHEFIDKDHFKTFYPLDSVRIFSKHGLESILNFISDNIHNPASLKSILTEEELSSVKKNTDKQRLKKVHDFFDANKSSFLAQPLLYPSKDKEHVRQTFQLDPISQIYMYDFVLRNKRSFENIGKEYREVFGYRFEKTELVSSIEEHRNYKEAIYKLKQRYQYLGKIDIANCFNNIYHHDMVSFISRTVSHEDSQELGRFLREINIARSTNCVPQGIIPAKILGNFFLSFIENSRQLNSDHIIRFMDDIYLFSTDKSVIQNDVLMIQRLLGEKGLALNESKSKITESVNDEIHEIEEIKKSLLQTRIKFIDRYTGDVEIEEHEVNLTEEQEKYLKDKLDNPKGLTEEDLELILTLLTTNVEQNKVLINMVLEIAPLLTKNLYYAIKRNSLIIDQNVISEFEKFVKNSEIVQEFQLFWIAKILIDFTELNENIVDIIIDIYNHKSAANVVKCVILEIQENGFGLLELKKQVARGNSNELVISSIVGLVSQEKSNRNLIYKYISKINPAMRVYTDILINLPHDAVLNTKSDIKLYRYEKNDDGPITLENTNDDSLTPDIKDEDLLF